MPQSVDESGNIEDWNAHLVEKHFAPLPTVVPQHVRFMDVRNGRRRRCGTGTAVNSKSRCKKKQKVNRKPRDALHDIAVQDVSSTCTTTARSTQCVPVHGGDGDEKRKIVLAYKRTRVSKQQNRTMLRSSAQTHTPQRRPCNFHISNADMQATATGPTSPTPKVAHAITCLNLRQPACTGDPWKCRCNQQQAQSY